MNKLLGLRCGIARQHALKLSRLRPQTQIPHVRLFSNIITSHFDHLDISFNDKNLPDMLLANLANDDIKDRTAFVDGTSGAIITYGTLMEETIAFSNGLIEMGIEKGDCVAIMAPTHLHYFTAFVGIALAGGFSTPINPAYTETEVKHQLDLTNPKLIITHTMCHDIVMNVSVERQIPVISMGGGDKSCKDTICIDEIISQNSSTRPAINIHLDDTLTVPFSSGTSGQPKGVHLTHRNVMANIVQMKALDKSFGNDTVILMPLPMFHIYGMVVGMLMPVWVQSKTVLMSSFDLVLFLELIQKHRVTRTFLVPPIVLALAKHPIVDNYDLSSLKALNCGAAPLGEETAMAVTSRLNCVVKQGWGMTELSPVGTMIPDDHPVVPPSACSGMLLPGTEALILDVHLPEGENEIPFITGEGTAEGELLIRGPQVMQGYYKNKDATQATIRPDKFMHTGDIARFDKDGFVYITDRLKELIKYKGFQVAPAELESIINSMDEVKDCVVIPIPNTEAGEVPRAYVVLQDDKVGEVSAETVQNFVKDRAAPYKQLRGGVIFVDSVPKSASGKLLRRVQIELDRAMS